jgi:hypothetical protein
MIVRSKHIFRIKKYHKKSNKRAIMVGGGKMKEENDQKIVKVRVSTMLYEIEREALRILAYRSGRSMSSCLRFLLREALDIKTK